MDLIAALTIALVVAPSAPSVGQAVALAWSAPADCPQAQTVRDAIDLSLARETLGDALDTVVVHGTIALDDENGDWVLRVRTMLPTGGVEREVRSPRCSDLAAAAGLIIAVDLDPLRVVQTAADARVAPASDRAAPPPAPVAPVQAAPLAAPPAADAGVAPRPQTPAPPGLAVDLRFGALGEFGSLGVLRAGAWVGVGLSGRRFRVDVAGEYWSPRRIVPFADHPSTGVMVQLGGVAVRGCFVPKQGVLAFATCLGAEAGAARGRGVGLAQTQTTHAPWLAAIIGQELAWIPRRVGIWVAVDAMLHLVRPRWTVQELGVAAQTRPIGLRLVVGPTVRL